VTEGALIIRAMPLIDGGRRIGTRLFLRMPRMCGKRVDTAEESTGFVSLRTVAGRLEDGGIPSSAQTSSSLWLPCCQFRRLLIVTSSTQAHATSSHAKQPFQRCVRDVHHSRLVDGNAIVFSLLHMHSFQICGEIIQGSRSNGVKRT
jgi:hypothetical protein